jgi:hypothetical protein
MDTHAVEIDAVSVEAITTHCACSPVVVSHIVFHWAAGSNPSACEVFSHFPAHILSLLLSVVLTLVFSASVNAAAAAVSSAFSSTVLSSTWGLPMPSPALPSQVSSSYFADSQAGSAVSLLPSQAPSSVSTVAAAFTVVVVSKVGLIDDYQVHLYLSRFDVYASDSVSER